MSVSGREDLPDIWQWSGGPPECPGVFRRIVRMSGSGREAVPDVRVCPGVVGWDCWMSGSGREAFPDVREWSGGPP